MYTVTVLTNALRKCVAVTASLRHCVTAPWQRLERRCGPRALPVERRHQSSAESIESPHTNFPQTSYKFPKNLPTNFHNDHVQPFEKSARSRDVFFSHTFLNASAMNQRICNSNSEEERPRVSKIVTKRTLKPRSNAVRSGQFRSLQPVLLDCWWKKRNFGLHVQQNMHLLTKFPEASLNSRLQVSTRCLAVQTQKNEMN